MVQSIAAADGIVQRRSFPNSFHGNTAAAGWEYVLDLNLPKYDGRQILERSRLVW